ncbi:hypothetical protein IU486_13200 [Streptomyces gardneri]|uniref:hypothetical protein n=1 Tax=Nocardia TaxID=1817 RepID=UPI00135A5399|nr:MULTISPECIES: hypothetical protein [Nocardia]MBF6165728.1 hypothetical protein [Streptomyces gardneri]MBF6203052.1 hypothetical protein [Streptomyces gardneri]UAK29924.1 hypothetical protein K8O92_18225 [Nocardia asteroides]
MAKKRINAPILLAASAALVAFGPVLAPASAQTQLQAPEVGFAGTAPGVVTATVHNPNGTGRCWAEAGVGPENNHRFFGNGGPESMAGPGQTVTATLEGLESGTTITARGGCFDDTPTGGMPFSELVTVTVP